MKFVHLIFWFNVALIAANLCAQTNLNPPLGYDESNDREFEDLESDSFLQPSPLQKPVENAALGLNRNGEQEYSVLENGTSSFEIQHESDSFNDSKIEVERFEPPSELNTLLTSLVLKNLPHEYTQDKKWGQQSKRWAGIKFRRDDDDGKIETKRRYKMVNHGTWQKYTAKLNDPREKFTVELIDIKQTRNGNTSMQVLFTADLNLEARQAKWVKGVQLYSMSAQGNAQVSLLVDCDLDMKMDLQQFPPDLVFAPVVTKAKIDVESFKLDKVSKAGGEVAQQVTRVAKKELESKINEKEKKLVKKLNQEIDENREKLRLSIVDAIKLKWFDEAKDHLPREVKEAIAANTNQQQSNLNEESRNAAVDTNRR